ncbi:hypothetical protein QR98_0103490 [Sarcoptes scabiei]|uniref:Uncharacterized protein n=1 Tax=Sarcoptes scabiei TaxID=52283 RepID=A0A132ALD9_SARSC|nr:hypothetical protein QR98_0103490 [Sarcoptes scabiei]
MNNLFKNLLTNFCPILVIVSIISINSLNALDGFNVCTRNETVPIEYEIQIPKPQEVQTLGWCLQIPPRCIKMNYVIRF